MTIHVDSEHHLMVFVDPDFEFAVMRALQVQGIELEWERNETLKKLFEGEENGQK